MKRKTQYDVLPKYNDVLFEDECIPILSLTYLECYLILSTTYIDINIILQNVIYEGVGGTLTSEYRSTIYYHEDKPKWCETVKVNKKHVD